MKDNKKHKKAEYGILITGLIILLAAACIIALCAGQYSVSVPEVIKILASRFVNVTKTWSNTAEGVVFTLRLPRIIGAVLVGVHYPYQELLIREYLRIRWLHRISWVFLLAHV